MRRLRYAVVELWLSIIVAIIVVAALFSLEGWLTWR